MSLPESAILDVRNTIIVYDNTIKHNKMFAVNYRPIFKKPTDTNPEYYDVIFVDDKVVRNYKLKGDNLILEKEDAHAFKEVPMIEFVNNKDYLGDFETVVSLIDAYNLIQSDRVNDREQLVDAILCFYGMKFTPEQMAELKENLEDASDARAIRLRSRRKSAPAKTYKTYNNKRHHNRGGKA